MIPMISTVAITNPVVSIAISIIIGSIFGMLSGKVAKAFQANSNRFLFNSDRLIPRSSFLNNSYKDLVSLLLGSFLIISFLINLHPSFLWLPKKQHFLFIFFLSTEKFLITNVIFCNIPFMYNMIDYILC